MIALLEKAEK